MTESDRDWLARRFEEHRDHLTRVADRMLGSRTEAEDAVQETWIRLSRTDTTGVENLGGWLTTVLARVCLDQLRSRKARPEASGDHPGAGPALAGTDPGHPEHDAMLAESVGLALLVVLDRLTPPERIAFVLHDMFGLPFAEIATVVGRTPAAARQLASRARRRVQDAAGEPPRAADEPREIVAAFLEAARGGDLGALLALLDPDVVVRADAAAVELGASAEVRGAGAVADTFSGRARAARPAVVDGAPALVWAPGGTPRVVFRFTIDRGRIVAIDLIADPARVGSLHLEQP